MKKGLICILLVCMMLLPLLVSCQQEADMTETDAEVYTLYMIVEDSTTPEAVHEVELALNRTIFYRLSAIVKLIPLHEDEYNETVDDMIAQTEAYLLEKKNKNKKNNSAVSDETSAASSEETEDDVSKLVKTGDWWLDELTAGREIELDHPQIDIFLAPGYERYYSLAFNGKLSALDEKLNNEAKALKSSIHSTLLTAAKVNKKTYGVPVNTAIGEYTYLIFDKELLDKYSVDPHTIRKMSDIKEYAQTLKENEPDVVPVMGPFPSAEIDFLVEDGFPAIVDNKYVLPAYETASVKSYLAMMARYRTLGFFENGEGKTGEEARCAIRIETASLDSLKAKYGEEDYAFTLYSNPIATNENTIENTICVSATVNSSNLTKVMQIVTAIYTDPDLMNLLTYGVKDMHYVVNERGQIERLNNDYIVRPEYVGNCFITSTLLDDDAGKWQKAIQQNQDARVSGTLGYTSTPVSFKYNDENGAEHEVKEPDYNEIICEIVNEYYPKLMQGNAIDLDSEALYKQAVADITQQYTNKLNTHYKDNVLKPMFEQQFYDEVVRTRGDELHKKAEETELASARSAAERELKRQLKAKFEKENPEMTSSEISNKISEMLTPEYIEENIYIRIPKEEVDAKIETTYKTYLSNETKDRLSAVVEAEDRIRKEVAKSAELKSKANDTVISALKPEAEAMLREMVKEELLAENPKATEAEIKAKQDEVVTADYVNKKFYNVFKKAEVEAMVTEELNKLVDAETKRRLQEQAAANPNLRAYLNEYEKTLNSAEYKEQLEALIKYDAPQKIEQQFDNNISAEISKYTGEMVDKMNTAIGEAVTAFVEENKDLLGMTEDELLYKIGFKKTAIASEGEESAETDENGDPVTKYEDAYESWYDFVFESKITAGYYSIFGKPTAG
ncbi:MAG: hypothetical protein IJQ53_05075 [Clostridia bacterium]|nr:hypothetical protein [Clostridia bacterium]